LRQLVTAVTLYAQDNDEVLPPTEKYLFVGSKRLEYYEPVY